MAGDWHPVAANDCRSSRRFHRECVCFGIDQLAEAVEQENEYLREEVQQAATMFGDLIGQAPALQAVTRQIELVWPTNALLVDPRGEWHRQRSRRP